MDSIHAYIREKKRHQLPRKVLPQLCELHSLLPLAATAANKTKPLQRYINMYKFDTAITRVVFVSECLTYVVINCFVVHRARMSYFTCHCNIFPTDTGVKQPYPWTMGRFSECDGIRGYSESGVVVTGAVRS